MKNPGVQEERFDLWNLGILSFWGITSINKAKVLLNNAPPPIKLAVL